MTNQPWQPTQGQGQGQPRGQGWQGQPPQPAPGWQPVAPQPRRGGGAGWIVLAVVAAVALLGGGAFLLPKLIGGGGPTAPPVPSSPGGPTQGTGGPEAEFGFGDAPPQVGLWTAQPVADGMTGMYYTAEGAGDEVGLGPMITVANSGMDLDVAVAGLGSPVESSGGRVVCGDAEFAFYDCYIDTAEFGTVFASASDASVTPRDVATIADAIAAQHP